MHVVTIIGFHATQPTTALPAAKIAEMLHISIHGKTI